jgi:branched-chain amino acid transport system ATP-binding protein
MLEVEDLRVSYGPVQAVRGVTLRVGTGEVVGLIGPNGAGKTSTLNALLGLVPATAIRLELDGRRRGSRPVSRWCRRAGSCSAR